MARQHTELAQFRFGLSKPRHIPVFLSSPFFFSRTDVVHIRIIKRLASAVANEIEVYDPRTPRNFGRLALGDGPGTGLEYFLSPAAHQQSAAIQPLHAMV